MQFLVRFDVHQPADMSAGELVSIWNEEAKAALGAVEAGAITGIWKVAGQRTVFALCEFPAHRSLEQALAGPPPPPPRAAAAGAPPDKAGGGGWARPRGALGLPLPGLRRGPAPGRR